MFRLVFLAIFIPPTWLSVHVLRTRRWPLFLRLALCALLYLVSQMMTINATVFGSLSGPDMPALLLEAQATAFTAEILCFLVVAVGDIARGLAALCRRAGAALAGRKERMPSATASAGPADPGRRAFLSRGIPATALLVAAPALGLGIAAKGVQGGTAVPLVNAMDLPVAGLAPDLDGLKILQITDIHVGTLTGPDWMRATVDLANACRPDLVCITGDLSDGLLHYACPGGATRLEVAGLLEGLRAPMGVWACAGNHEFYSDYRGWMRAYERIGIRMLRNGSVFLPRGGAGLVLAGRDDMVGVQRFGFPRVSAQQVLAGMPGAREGALRVMMDHRPTRAEENAAAGCGLQLSGHTHGGQCHGLEDVVARANRGRVRGWYTVEGMPLYVCSGAGLWSGFPVRLGVPAEMALLTLRARPAA